MFSCMHMLLHLHTCKTSQPIFSLYVKRLEKCCTPPYTCMDIVVNIFVKTSYTQKKLMECCQRCQSWQDEGGGAGGKGDKYVITLFFTHIFLPNPQFTFEISCITHETQAKCPCNLCYLIVIHMLIHVAKFFHTIFCILQIYM